MATLLKIVSFERLGSLANFALKLKFWRRRIWNVMIINISETIVLFEVEMSGNNSF